MEFSVQRWIRFYISSAVTFCMKSITFILLGVNLLTKYFIDLSKQTLLLLWRSVSFIPKSILKSMLFIWSADNLKPIWWRSWDSDTFYSQWFTSKQLSWFGFQVSKNYRGPARSQTMGLYEVYKGLRLRHCPFDTRIFKVSKGILKTSSSHTVHFVLWRPV